MSSNVLNHIIIISKFDLLTFHSFFFCQQTKGSDTPTQAPIASPKPCTDSTLRIRITYQNRFVTRDCTWVANKSTYQRCRVEGVSGHCPVTCGTCSTCIDSTLRFKLTWKDKYITRDCIWIANKATWNRCKVEGVSESCRVACGTC